MSSDSDEDCYGNIAQKLQSIKSKYKEDTIETSNLFVDSIKADSAVKQVNKVIEIFDNSSKKDSAVSRDDSDLEEISLDAIIANNSKKRQTRISKRNADISADNILPTRGRKRSKASNKSSQNSTTASPASNLSSTNQSVSAEVSNSGTLGPNISVTVSTRRIRGGRRSRGGASISISNIDTNLSITNTNTTASNPNITASNTNTTASNTNTTASNSNTTTRNTRTTRRQARGRSRQRTPRSRRTELLDLFPMFFPSSSSYPTYSVGNTDEYPDECYDQPLFTEQNKKTDDVIVVGENELENDVIDENEDLSVKVYWQNCEVIKFMIRRFQKFTPIFDFFANRENVSHDKLFFTYNDKILKVDDTPDSITYSIVKFIDGGIVNQSVLSIVQKDQSTAKDGITLKFQCQNVKKPFNTVMRLDEKLAVAFMMCAEHLEKPLDKLKFHFDGDLISGKNTPRELELEGGECIDVTICS